MATFARKAESAPPLNATTTLPSSAEPRGVDRASLDRPSSESVALPTRCRRAGRRSHLPLPPSLSRTVRTRHTEPRPRRIASRRRSSLRSSGWSANRVTPHSQSSSPVEPGDELQDPAAETPADGAVADHELLALFEAEGVPVVFGGRAVSTSGRSRRRACPSGGSTG